MNHPRDLDRTVHYSNQNVLILDDGGAVVSIACGSHVCPVHTLSSCRGVHLHAICNIVILLFRVDVGGVLLHIQQHNNYCHLLG